MITYRMWGKYFEIDNCIIIWNLFYHLNSIWQEVQRLHAALHRAHLLPLRPAAAPSGRGELHRGRGWARPAQPRPRPRAPLGRGARAAPAPAPLHDLVLLPPSLPPARRQGPQGGAGRHAGNRPFNEGLRRFYNHREGSYLGGLLRHYAKEALVS